MARDDWKKVSSDSSISRKEGKNGDYFLTSTKNTEGSNKEYKQKTRDNHVHVHKDGADVRMRMKDGTIVNLQLGDRCGDNKKSKNKR